MEAGTYFIEVRTESYHNDSPYVLSVAFHASTVWEIEYNNQVEQANPFAEGFFQYGNLSDYDDVDYYVFQCEESGDYQLMFEHDNFTEEMDGWVLDILDKNSDSLWEGERLYSQWCATSVSKKKQT